MAIPMTMARIIFLVFMMVAVWRTKAGRGRPLAAAGGRLAAFSGKRGRRGV